MIETSCTVCEQRFVAQRRRVEMGYKKTCSRACRYAAVARALAEPIRVRCATCGADVTKTPTAAKRPKHGAFFCSRACHYAGRALGHTKRVVTKPYSYTPEGKSAMMMASCRPKGKRVLHILACAHCGGTFDDPTDGKVRKSGKAFCSLLCCNAHRRGKNNPAWKGGHPTYYGPRWRPAQRAARARDGRTCRRCGTVQARRALDVHHIQPVRTFPKPDDAHDLSNLVCLCPRCHHTVEHHGIDFPL